MADKDGNKHAKNFGFDQPAENKSFHVKGIENVDWGMKTRLSQIFDPKSGNTIMLAFDHGYIMGPTQGLERLDLAIPPLMDYADVLMGTRSFPNKRILRNNLCLPACRVLMYKKMTLEI